MRHYEMEILLLTIFIIVIVPSSNALCDVSGSVEGTTKLSEWTGLFQSPGSDTGQYPGLQDCTWEILVSSGSTIQLTIEDFKLEDGVLRDSSPEVNKDCNDYVAVYDAKGMKTKLCGTLYIPLILTSTSNSMRIVFHSNDENQAKGFKASYTGICGGDVSVNSLLETPNFPKLPPDGVTCSWKMIGPQAGFATAVQVVGLESFQENKSDYPKLPPKCGRSPLKIKTLQTGSTAREVCLQDAIHASMDSMDLTFEMSTSSQPWAGQIIAAYQTLNGCDDFCVHHTNCSEASSLRSGKELDHRCECAHGYTGRNCEVKLALVDPCALDPCAHGICENMRELGEYLCYCEENYTGTQCDVALTDACTGVTCQNQGVCKIIDDIEYVCLCAPNSGYIGQHCNIPVGSGYCRQEQDSVPGSRIIWSDTPVNETDFQVCPGVALGNASRHCLSDQYSPTGGVWTWPDLSMCVSPQVFQLSVDAMNLLEPTSTSGSSSMESPTISNITSRLLDVTRPIVDVPPGESPLYPGDLLLTADVMTTVSKAAESANLYGVKEALDVTKQYTSAVDNLVDPRTQQTWRNARAHLVENRVSSVIKATQNLISTMLRRNPKLRLESGTLRKVGGARMSNPGDTIVSLTARNIDISVSQVDLRNGSHNFRYSGVSSSVEFSTSILSQENAWQDVPASVYIARFQSLSALLSMREERYIRALSNTTVHVNSDVVSAAVLYVPEEKFSVLRTPIVLTFVLKDPRLRETEMEKCVFMNMDAISYSARWSSRGCHVAKANDTHVVCYCFHLTNFAILMDVYGTQDIIDDEQDIILTYISYIGSVLSILACMISIGTFQYLGLSSDRVRIHQQLGLSIIMVQILFICVGVTGEAHGTPRWGCRLLAILLHYSLTAMFCWMLVEGIHIYVVLVRVFKIGSHLKKYSAMGWGIPLLVVGISTGAFLDHYGGGKVCWLDHELLLICFVPTVGLVILINTLILGIVIRTMMNSNSVAQKISQLDHNNFRVSVKATAVLLPLLGLTWVLGFLAVDTGGTHALTYVFTYLFTLTNSFQGVLFFIFHCLLNVDVHQAYERRYRRRKRLSLAETLSTRTRKSSEPDVFSPHRMLTNTKSTATTRSTLTNLSVGGDIRSIIKTTDSDPFGSDGFLRLPRFSTRWQGFTSQLIPEPDYPNSFRRHEIDTDNSFHEHQDPKLDSEVSGQVPNTVTAGGSDESDSMSTGTRRNSRTSVRFT